MGSIFCIGQSAYDITIPLDGAICENQKYRVTQKEECGGGPAFNAAYLCAMWGEKVELISRKRYLRETIVRNCCTGWNRNQLSDQG